MGRGDLVLTLGADASGFHRSVGQTLNQFGKLSSQAAGRAAVFGRALEALGDIGGRTGAVLGNILGGFAAGGAFGLAVGAVNAVVAVVRQSGEEAEKAAKEHAQAGERIAGSYKNASGEVAVLVAELRGGAVAAAQMRAQLTIGDAEDEIRKMEKALVKARQAQDEYSRAFVRTEGTIQQHAQNVAAAERNVAAARAAAGAVMVDEALKQNKVIEQVEKARQKEVTQAAKERWDAEHRFIEQADAHVRAYYAHQEQMMRDLAAGKGSSGFEEEGARAVGYYALKLNDAKEAQTAYERELARTTATYQQWGSVAASTVSSVIMGQASAGEALRSLAGTVIQSLIQMLFQKAAAALAAHALEKPVKVAEVISAAGVAGAEATAASAYLGPAAPAVGAEVAAMVLSQFLPLASAAGGMKVPYDMLAMVHEDERVLPARYSEGLDRMVEDAARGGGRGGGITVQVAGIIDGRNFERALTANDGAVARAQRKMRRRRVGR